MKMDTKDAIVVAVLQIMLIILFIDYKIEEFCIFKE
jgi:hypothetical protein